MSKTRAETALGQPADPTGSEGRPGPKPALAGIPALALPPELVGADEARIFEWMRATGKSPLPVRGLQIETSSLCNFRCASCPLSLDEYDRPQQHLCKAEFTRILDAFPHVQKIELQGIGEVFLNPELFELIAIAVARGIDVQTFSNASRVTLDKAFALVRSGLSHINFSMDAADPETFRRLRKGGQLRVYKRCVSNVLAARRALGSATPRVGIMTVLSKANLRQVPQMLAIAEELGVETLMLTKINGSFAAGQEVLELDAQDRAWLDALPPYRGRVEVVPAYTPWTTAERMDCYWPRHMAYVTVEGDVTPCCNYFDSREMNLGNALRQSGAEIWDGEPYRAFRKRLFSGDLPERCQRC